VFAIYLGPIVLLVLVMAYFAWVQSHPADDRTPAVFNCGREDCKYRNRVNHRHQAGLQ
jgi:hypothetical protein